MAKIIAILEDSLQFYEFQEIDLEKIVLTNTLERLKMEIQKHAKVIGISLSESSYIRLIYSYLMMYKEK